MNTTGGGETTGNGETGSDGEAESDGAETEVKQFDIHSSARDALADPAFFSHMDSLFAGYTFSLPREETTSA